jgi:acetyl esterase/lipase
MTKRITRLLGAGLATLVVAAQAAQPPPAAAIPLYDHPVAAPPADEGDAEVDETALGHHVLRNVTAPTLTPYLPDPAIATGTAAIVAPGGGFLMLEIDSEGTEVARWLAAHGVAAFVLKYRLAHTPHNGLLYMADLMKKLMVGFAHSSSSALPILDGETDAAADGLQAMRLVEKRAAEWGVDPKRVGFLGFSAGGMTALHVATECDASSRPAFIAPIYAQIDLPKQLPADLPPMFTAMASGDPFFGRNPSMVYDAWRKAGAPAELHLYEKGGHGFGMRVQHLSSDHWIDEFGWWLEGRGLLKPEMTPARASGSANG